MSRRIIWVIREDKETGGYTFTPEQVNTSSSPYSFPPPEKLFRRWKNAVSLAYPMGSDGVQFNREEVMGDE